MQKITYFFLLILLITTPYSIDAKKPRFILLEDKAVHLVDGIEGLLDAEAIRDSLDVRRIINNIVHGTKDHTTGLFKKYYTLEGWSEKIALNDLVQLAAQYTKDSVPFENQKWIALTESLNSMKQEFKDRTEPLLASASKAIQVNMRLIREWISKSGRHDSMLLLWGTIDEEKALWESTPAQLKQFLIDLQNFLKDLMFSCPKARKKYSERYIKELHKQVEFEAIFRHQ